MPDMEYVESTNIDRIGYDAENLELHVEFKGGATYVYMRVPQWIHTELLAAPSKGSYLNRMIKDEYDFRKA